MQFLTLLTLGVAVVCTSSCANKSGASMGLTSATAPVIAMLKDDLFVGTTVGYMDRTGTIDITSTLDSTIRCIGSFHYTGSNNGKGEMQCNDGVKAVFTFNQLTMLSGFGYGSSDRGVVGFTYGLTPDEATQYLKFPKGKTIRRTLPNQKIQLTDI